MQKRILTGLMLLAVTANAYAIDPGFYMGLMTGPANNGGGVRAMQALPLPTPGNRTATSAPANPSSNQFGTRLYFGYKFNQYAGFEGGFTYFSGITYNFKNNDTLVPAAGRTGRVRGIDFVGKLDYSYSNTIGLFGKGGASLVYTTTPGALNVTNYTVIGSPPKEKIVTSGSNTYTTKFAPTFALGGTYDFNQNWQAELSWTRIFTGGSINYMNLYAIGLSYHFVNVYCGQFLCDNN